MTILVILGGVLFGSIVLFVVFSNVYLELTSRRMRKRRQQARLRREEADRSNHNTSKLDPTKDADRRQREHFAV